MLVAAPVLSLIFGISVLGGIFLTWSTGSLPETAAALSGWDIFMGEGAMSSTPPLLVLAGGILMVFGSLFVAFGVRGGLRWLLGTGAIIGSIVAVAGSTWALVYMWNEGLLEFAGAGMYVSTVSATVGFIIGVVTASTAFADVSTAGSGSSSSSAVGVQSSSTAGWYSYRYSAREYLERQAGRSSSPAPVVTASSTATENFNRATQCEAMGQNDEAIALYAKAIEMNREYALAYFNRGSLLMMQGRRVEALPDFEKVVSLAPSPELVLMAENRLKELNGRPAV